LTNINASGIYHTNIYNTYQCYKLDIESKLSTHCSLLDSIQAPFACKLVKGAYLEFEKKRKTLLRSKEEVMFKYQSIMEWLVTNSKLRQDKTFVMLATHNISCLKMFNSLMLSKTSSANFTTGYLHGFLNNGAWFAGKKCKYTPYGSSDEAWEYVKRRIHENRESVSKFD
jgi:proline dehydrogenase